VLGGKLKGLVSRKHKEKVFGGLCGADVEGIGGLGKTEWGMSCAELGGSCGWDGLLMEMSFGGKKGGASPQNWGGGSKKGMFGEKKHRCIKNRGDFLRDKVEEPG